MRSGCRARTTEPGPNRGGFVGAFPADLKQRWECIQTIESARSAETLARVSAIHAAVTDVAVDTSSCPAGTGNEAAPPRACWGGGLAAFRAITSNTSVLNRAAVSGHRRDRRSAPGSPIARALALPRCLPPER